MTTDRQRYALHRALLGTVCALGLLACGPVQAAGDAAAPVWQPQVSERLIKLPAAALESSIERDFRGSPLATALQEADQRIEFKHQTLADIKAAIGLADEDAQRQALRHQFLTEKREFVRIAMNKNELRRGELETRRQLLERVLAGLGADEAATTESRRRLIEQQKAAQERMAASLEKIDAAFLASEAAPPSKYHAEYEEKVAAIDRLRQAIGAHPMNAEPVIDGEAVTKGDYVRHLVATVEGELALLEMEDEILGYMAKLVSLDALALAEEVDDPELVDSDVAEPSGVVAAVDFFVAD